MDVEASLRRYLSALLPLLLEGDDSVAAAAATPSATEALAAFASDDKSVLFVYWVVASDDGSAAPGYTFALDPQPDLVATQAPCISLVKRVAGSIVSTRSVASQLQVIALASAAPDGGTEDADEGAKQAEAADDGANTFTVLRSYVQHAFKPLLQARALERAGDAASGAASKRDKGLEDVNAKLQALETALQHVGANSIPVVTLAIDPQIQAAVEAIAAHPDIADIAVDALSDDQYAAVGLSEATLRDDAWLNKLQKLVSKTWKREILKVTKFDRDLSQGSVFEEVKYWQDLDASIRAIHMQRNAPTVSLTFTVLRRAGRHMASLHFDEDTQLSAAKARATGVMGVMRDFPIAQLLGASTIETASEALGAVFQHMRKLVTGNEVAKHYEGGARRGGSVAKPRIVLLIEALSRELLERAVAILSNSRVLYMHIQPFRALVGEGSTSDALWAVWEKHFDELYSRIEKRERGADRSRVKTTRSKELAHEALRERLTELRVLRDEHEKLRSVIERVLRSDELDAVNVAFAALADAEALDTSERGAKVWRSARLAYDQRIERVEEKIKNNMVRELTSCTSSDQMFEVFGRYNKLFYRRTIKGAIHSYQRQLIESVKKDIMHLQEKFRSTYSRTEACHMAHVRDFPQVSGAMMWAKQIDRRLDTYQKNIQKVLGDDWEKQNHGRVLKDIIDAFKSKLDTNGIYEKWWKEVTEKNEHDSEPNSGPVLQVSDSGTKIEVRFDASTMNLFKEVRNIMWLIPGVRIPYMIKACAREAKNHYPKAMSLQAALRTYERTQQKIDRGVAPLMAGRIKEIMQQIGFFFEKSIVWEGKAEALENRVLTLHDTVIEFQDKVEELLVVHSEIADAQLQLERCAFDAGAFAAILTSIQHNIDKLNLAGFSNLHLWVQTLDASVAEVLGRRLGAALAAWVAAQRHNGASDDDARAPSSPGHRRSSRGSSFNEAALKKMVGDAVPGGAGASSSSTGTAAAAAPIALPDETFTYSIVLRNRVLQLEPPLENARVAWVEQLHAFTGVVCALPRLQSERYDTALGGARALSDAGPSTFGDVLLAQLPAEAVLASYGVIELGLAKASAYVSEWLQYQALWDMETSRLFAHLEADLPRWQQVLNEIKQARATFDNFESQRRFGVVVIEYARVRDTVRKMYDERQKEILGKFGAMLGDIMHRFHSEVSQDKVKLEHSTLETDTASVIEFITLVQAYRRTLDGRKGELSRFEKGQRLLEKQRFSFPTDWLWFGNVEGEWAAFEQILRRKVAAIEGEIPALQQKILHEERGLNGDITREMEEWNERKPLASTLGPAAALDTIAEFARRTSKLKERMASLKMAKDALELEPPETGRLVPMDDEITALREVWAQLQTAWTELELVKSTQWASFVTATVRKQLAALQTQLRAMPSRIRQYEPFEHVRSVVDGYRSSFQLVMRLAQGSLKQRHWRVILNILKITRPLSQLTLGMLWDAGLASKKSRIEEIVGQAQGEQGLEQFLAQVKESWVDFKIDLAPYQSTPATVLIRGFNDMLEKLDEHLSSLAQMKQSQYFKVFQEEAMSWEDKLARIRDVLNVWIDVQRRWVYLEGIFFSSADIKQQLPSEYQRFRLIHTEFVALMRKVKYKPEILQILAIDDLQRTLERLCDRLLIVQKALGEYLEKQRGAFSRFYFVGDEDLLEIIGNSNDPVKIQRHMAKLYAGICALDFTPDNAAIVGIISKEGEHVALTENVDVAGESTVWKWLRAVELSMQKTLATQLSEAIAGGSSDGGVKAFVEWLDKYPAQIVLLSSCLRWSRGVEEALGGGGGERLAPVLASVVSLLKLLAGRVLLPLARDTRKKHEQLITELVHQRDATRALQTEGVTSPTDFDWLIHLRYKWTPSEPALLRRLEISVANASFFYGFEYLGVADKLVQTPLTDRCYLTLTQGLHFRLGGNPFGPAGTGKTESVKMLGAAMGRFVLVFNCDETFDFQAMGRIFRGLCQVGAWGCFDEFNRLEEAILSAVSQQILVIQHGLQRATAEIELLGKPCLLSDNVGIFITMNPGYAGRSNLPDNLKQLFRGIAMIKPNWGLIAQVMLFSQGFVTAEALASKIVLMFSLCEDQLSAQSHYDFGLRALKSVLISAGNLKRAAMTGAATDAGAAESEPEKQNIEDVERGVLLESVTQSVVPILVSIDVELFDTILTSVFPGAERHAIPAAMLRTKIAEICAERHLQCEPSWVEKMLQLYEVQKLRHGVMMVGPSGVGKSAAWSVLLDAMGRCDSIKSDTYIIDAKAAGKEALYGVLDNTTMEWKDGIFTRQLRAVINSERGESERRHWIIFDGDVDPEWAENLNSVLDDNKLLTLPTGDRLAIPDNVRIMFQVDTLKYATKATVSRCGMVWFSTDALPVHCIFAHQLDILRHHQLGGGDGEIDGASASAGAQFVACIASAFEQNGFVQSMLEWSLAEGDHVMETTRMRLIRCLFSLLKRGVDKVDQFNEEQLDFKMSKAQLARYAPKVLVFALLWGLGASLNYSGRLALGKRIVEMTTVELPGRLGQDGLELIDFEVVCADGEWKEWRRPERLSRVEIESHEVLSTSKVIDTVDTVRNVEVLFAWLRERRPLILCGPPGSGKTMTLTKTLSEMEGTELVQLNFSSGTTPALILKTFEQYCEYERKSKGLVLKPVQPGKWLIVFCDEINLPANDAYGTQRVISFMRQLVKHGGFYRPKDLQWVAIERIQFVGACNPPTDPGRVPMSDRWLSHAPVMLVDYPAPDSLRQIYGTFVRGLLKMQPDLRGMAEEVTHAMVEVFLANQQHFTPDQHAHYVYSPRELSRWIRALYEAMEPLDAMSLGEFVRLFVHEALRLFHDRLCTQAERDWCRDSIDAIARARFPQAPPEALQHPMLYCKWLTKEYQSVSREELRKLVEAKLHIFYEEELDKELVVFDDVLDHILRIDRILRQPVGHALLVGESGAGKTVLSRFVAWMNGLTTFQIKVSKKYTVEHFEEDLRAVLKRSGCDGEKICFIFDESNILDTAFLEMMNALLASGEVPGLFEGDEYSALMASCRDAASRDGLIVDSEDELFRHFTKQVQRNLHVVFTMNPASGDFDNRSNTSPALFNRCVVDWFGTWSNHALAQVGLFFTSKMYIDSTAYRATLVAKEWAARALPLRDEASVEQHVAIVGCMVKMHKIVQLSAALAGKRSGVRNFISPRDFIDLIEHFSATFAEKRDQLEEEQRHVSVGLEKLKETDARVAELQIGLAEKQQMLSVKEKEGEEKLEEVVNLKNEANIEKKHTAELQEKLEVKTQEVDVERARVGEALAEVMPMVDEAKAALSGLKKDDIKFIKQLRQPPPKIPVTLDMVMAILRVSPAGKTAAAGLPGAGAGWNEMRGCLDAKFIRLLQEADFEASLPDAACGKIKKKFMAQLDYSSCRSAATACGAMYKWADAMLNYSRVKNSIEPLERQKAELEAEAATCSAELVEAKRRQKTLKRNISRYTQEYNALLSSKEQIKRDVEQVLAKQTRATGLLSNLKLERVRWRDSSESFADQLSTLSGDTFFAAAFQTYFGFFDHKGRHVLAEEFRACLDEFGISLRDELELVEYLSTTKEAMEWASCSLPNGRLFLENAILLSRYNRYPLVVDPSGQALKFIQNQFKQRGVKHAQTSFLNSAFMNDLERCVRFGTPLLVEDVERIDPVLNPILNKEYQKTGGRTLVRLGEQEIDFSPQFSMIMLTRDSTFQFTPDICSRVTFVNFTMTPASLKAQCLSNALKHERPDVDAKRVELIKLKGEYQSDIRELEANLLETLSKTEGNILDNDALMQSLVDLKTKSTEVTEKMANCDSELEVVRIVTDHFEIFAKVCSDVFFCSQRVAGIQRLYQFSYKFFLSIVDTVLATGDVGAGASAAQAGESEGISPRARVSNAITSADTARLAELVASLYTHSYKQLSLGLLQHDALALALVFVQAKLKLEAVAGAAGAEAMPMELVDVLLNKTVHKAREKEMAQVKVALPSLSDAKAANMAILLALPAYAAWLPAAIATASEEWNNLIRADLPEVAIPPSWGGSAGVAGKFEYLLVLRALRPDRVVAACEAFIVAAFGSDFLTPPPDALATALKAAIPGAPQMLLSTVGYDASGQVDSLAAAHNKTGRQYKAIAMGSTEAETLADRAIEGAMRHGTWVLLRNVHMCPTWLANLEKKLYNKTTKGDFRIFMTAEIHPKLPINMMRLAACTVFEAPSGFKNAMLRSLETMPAARMNAQPSERARLYFLIAWLHACILERLTYAPLGWTKKYEFSSADRECALRIVDDLVDATARGRAHIDPASIPWKALRTSLGQSIYGGRIDNPFDDVLLNSLLDALFVPESFDIDFPLVMKWDESGVKSAFMVSPEGTSRSDFVQWVDGLGHSGPQWLGLPPTAELQLLQDEGEALLSKVLILQDNTGDDDDDSAYRVVVESEEEEEERSSSAESDGGPAWMGALVDTATQWLADLPPELALLPTDGAEVSSAVYRFYSREVRIGSRTLLDVRRALREVVAVCTGAEKPTQQLREVIAALKAGAVPLEWARAYAIAPSLTAGQWVSDFKRRVEQLESVVNSGVSRLRSTGVWLGGLFAPEAYLMALRQVVASKNKWSLEEVALEVQMNVAPAALAALTDGVVVHGMVLEGAAWDSAAQELALASAIAHPLENATLSWVNKATLSDRRRISVPVYLNRNRSEMLFTVDLAGPLDAVPPSVWAQRGLALVAWSKGM